MVEFPLATLGGLHDRPVNCAGAGAFRDSDADCAPPLADAVMSADWVVATAAAFIVNVDESRPAPTMIVAGSVMLALLLARATTMPPVGLGLVRETVQVVEAAPVNDVETQERALTPEGRVAPDATVRVPPDAETGSVVPSFCAAMALLTVMAVVCEGVALTTATTPLPITVVLTPYATQVKDPVPAWQDKDFPAPVRAGPAATESPLSDDCGN